MSAPGALPSADQIAIRLRGLEADLRAASEAGGHDPDRLRIVAVTKGWPIEVCRAALDAGCRLLGENRVQDGEPKVAALPDADWHLVGRLQANKVRRALRAFGVVHSIDSAELLRRVDAVAHDEGRAPRVLLQVNVSGEASKAGFAPHQLDAIEATMDARLVGLMTIAPMGATEDEARRVFGALRRLRDGLQDRIGQALPELSMGMSADAAAAAREGATMVRIGTALFGPRA